MYSLVLENIMGTASDSLPDSMAKLTTDYKAIITVIQAKYFSSASREVGEIECADWIMIMN